jgi:isopentenyl diphosphate isomerase/L-lactate dehydrogenase-like FMN-dependent dehydrogenase
MPGLGSGKKETSMAGPAQWYNVADVRRAAQRRLPKALFEFIDRATEDDIAMRHNRAAIEALRIVPRLPRDVSGRDLSTTLFGAPLSMPLLIAPTGASGVMWHEAELCLARAAKAAGVPYTMATGAMVSFERVAREVGGRLWFQLYLWPAREHSYDLVRRVAAAGAEALVVTVDTPVSPNREYNTRNGFGSPFRPNAANVADMLLHPRWLLGTLARYLAAGGMPTLRNHPPEYQDPRTRDAIAPRLGLSDDIDLAEIARLRAMFPGKLLVKGIMHPDDARAAVAAGADGVIVSNHGGRNLDAAIATFEALPAVAAAIGDRATVIVDSGIRRGLDIVKARALGAHAVQTGRATLWGASAAGEPGVARVLAILRHELDTAMANVGVRRIDEIGPDLLAPGGST